MAARLREALPSPALTITIGDFEEVDVEKFIRHQFGNQVTRPIVVTLTTARVT
jgi:protoporphyrinogen oxidase